MAGLIVSINFGLLYMFDRLALRAGHEKDEDEDEADTVGCCTLKVPLVLPARAWSCGL